MSGYTALVLVVLIVCVSINFDSWLSNRAFLNGLSRPSKPAVDPQEVAPD